MPAEKKKSKNAITSYLYDESDSVDIEDAIKEAVELFSI